MKSIEGFLVIEEYLIKQLRNTSVADTLQRTRKDMLEHICSVTKSSNLNDMVQTEKFILEYDLDRFSNSRAMEASLKAGINEMAVIQRHLSIVDDAQQYKAVDDAYSLPKNRQKGLPLDEARQGFKSHFARLVNMDKSRLDDDEKQIIDARKAMISEAQRLYIARQAKTLGVALQTSRTQKRG